MKSGILAAFGIAIAVFVLSCSDKPTSIRKDDPPTPPRTLNQLTANELSAIESFNKFGWNLFTKIYDGEDPDGNIFMSPLSVSYALGMAVNGARGETREAMMTAMELQGLSLDEMNVAYKELASILASADASVKFTLANSFWYDEGIGIVSTYSDRCREYFDADVTELEFSDSDAADIMNGWVKDKTNDKIKNIVPDPVPDDWAAAIINAIYFKGDWTYPFKTEKTRQAEFHLASGGTASIQMMRRSHHDDVTDFHDLIQQRPIGTFDQDNAMGFNLPYGGEGFIMTVILPAEGKTLNDLIPSITADQLNTWGARTASNFNSIQLPRFKFKWDDSLIEALKAMGMGLALSDQADFGDMFSHIDSYISEVRHAGFVQVDEKGTEAAAATVVGFPTSAPPDYICNRPFLFVIQERTSGAILFIGKVGNPVWQD